MASMNRTSATAAACLVFSICLAAAPLPAATAGSLPPPSSDGDFYEAGSPSPDKVQLGRMLFFDKLLSGNRNISCATCHHSLTDTGDGLSLPVGEGGRGLGVTRDTGKGRHAIHERVPRNAPPVFNLGAREFRRMFHDGRVEVDKSQPSGFRSPADLLLPPGLDNVLAVQAMFPVTSGAEMAGQAGENPIGAAAAAGNLVNVWGRLAARLANNTEYLSLFSAAFDDISGARDITYVHAANAIAAFEAHAWRADNSPFDRYLRGNAKALSPAAKRGMRLFYGQADCADCHSGTFQTDHKFHAIAMPQIGPGKGDGSGIEDFGRERVTSKKKNKYEFRTPSLRNVALTGPWGHDGAFDSLRAVVEHHLDPIESLYNYDPGQAVLPSRADLDAIDFQALEDGAIMAEIEAACELAPQPLSQKKVDYILEFLWALTDPASVDLRQDVPTSLPSGLPVAD